MISASAQAAAILAGPAIPYQVRITSIRGSEVLADDIPVEDGYEEDDAASRVPELVTLRIPRVKDGYDWSPNGDDTHPLAAAGQKLAVLVLIDGEPVQRGVFPITDVDTDGDTVFVQAGGLLYLLQEAKLRVPFVPSGTLKSTLRGLIEPAITVNFDSGLGDRSVPAGLNVDDDRLDAVYALLEAWPAEVYIDQSGVAQVTRPKSTPGLWLPGVVGSVATTPDHPSLDVTDLDVSADVTMLRWSGTSTAQEFVSRWSDGSGDNSFIFGLYIDGRIIVIWSSNGSNILSTYSSVPVSAEDGSRLALRWTMDVNNGSGQRVHKFYVGPTADGPWTQLGSNVTESGATAIHAGSLPLSSGSHANTTNNFAGIIHQIRMYNGDRDASGTLVASADFDQQPETTGASFVDSTSKTWTVQGAAYIIPQLSADVTVPRSRIIRAYGKSTRKGVYTAVVARGKDSSGTPLSAVVYRSGPKGYPGLFNGLAVPYVLESDLLTTPGQCQAAAQAKMAQLSRDTGRTLELEVVPDPRIQLGDILNVDCDAYSGLAMVTKVRLPLAATTAMPPMRLTVVTIDG